MCGWVCVSYSIPNLSLIQGIAWSWADLKLWHRERSCYLRSWRPKFPSNHKPGIEHGENKCVLHLALSETRLKWLLRRSMSACQGEGKDLPWSYRAIAIFLPEPSLWNESVRQRWLCGYAPALLTGRLGAFVPALLRDHAKRTRSVYTRAAKKSRIRTERGRGFQLLVLGLGSFMRSIDDCNIFEAFLIWFLARWMNLDGYNIEWGSKASQVSFWSGWRNPKIHRVRNSLQQSASETVIVQCVLYRISINRTIYIDIFMRNLQEVSAS